MRKILSLFLLLTLHFVSYGVYLENVPHQLVQPNGELLNVFITGDEFFRRVHDSEGYSIVQGSDGWYYYALYDAVADELVPSEYVVSESRTTDLPMAKGLGISHEKYMEIRRAYYEPTGCDVSGMRSNSILTDLAKDHSKTTKQMNNIIICIGFADTENMSKPFEYVDGMFNSNENNNMNDYYLTMSYNQLDLKSHFYPPADENILRFYKDTHPRDYYRPYSASNPIGYSEEPGSSERVEREQTLLRDAVNWMNENWPVPLDINLDINNDGNCDFISFIVYGNVGAWSSLLWPHKWTLFIHDVRINGKRISEYNFELDGAPTYFNVGTFCHEGFHVLGAPDLYHYNTAFSSLKAVGSYDVMDETKNNKPQSMSAYLKYKYGKWISALPVATINKTYEVYPFYMNDGTNEDKPVIYRIPMTYSNISYEHQSQYSVVEYRKKKECNYDKSLSNEGFMIYRINSEMGGNAGFNGEDNLDEVYLYRPGSHQEDGTPVYTQGNLNQAPFNPVNARTEFNQTTNPKPCLSEGQLEKKGQNINHILYDEETDSYTFFYGDPKNRSMQLDKNELILGQQSGSNGAVRITSNVFWRISIPEEATSWISASKTRGINDANITFRTLTANSNGTPRTTDVLFTSNEDTLVVKIIQDIVEIECKEEILNLEVNIDITKKATLRWDPLPAGILFNIYLDGKLIVEDLDTNMYQYSKPFATSEDHLWCVTALCPAHMESEKFCYTTSGEIFDIQVTTNNAAGGSVSGGGSFAYGDEVIVTATPNPEYLFIYWTVNGKAVSTDKIYKFRASENITLVATFRLAKSLKFDTYVVTKWNNTFVLNIKQLKSEKIEVAECVWFKNGEKIGNGFYYSAGSKSTDLLETDVIYTFEVYTRTLDTLISTSKIIQRTVPPSNLIVYPNPVPQGYTLTIENTNPNSVIEVYNLNGICVNRTTATDDVTELTLALPAGIYFVRHNNKEAKVIIK